MSQINLDEIAQQAMPFSPLNFRSKTMSQIKVEDENQEAFYSPGATLTTRRNTMPEITVVDDKTQDAIPFTSPLFSHPRKPTDPPPLSSFNLLRLNCRVPCKEYKQHHKLIQVWNKEVILAAHPAILKPTPKQHTLNTLEDLDFDIKALNHMLAPLIEAERLLGAKGFCQIGKVNGLAFAAALTLPAKQRGEEIKLLEGQIDRMNDEYIALYACSFDLDDGDNEPKFESGFESGGPVSGDGIGGVCQSCITGAVADEDLTTTEEGFLDAKRLRPFSM